MSQFVSPAWRKDLSGLYQPLETDSCLHRPLTPESPSSLPQPGIRTSVDSYLPFESHIHPFIVQIHTGMSFVVSSTWHKDYRTLPIPRVRDSSHHRGHIHTGMSIVVSTARRRDLTRPTRTPGVWTRVSTPTVACPALPHPSGVAVTSRPSARFLVVGVAAEAGVLPCHAAPVEDRLLVRLLHGLTL